VLGLQLQMVTSPCSDCALGVVVVLSEFRTKGKEQKLLQASCVNTAKAVSHSHLSLQSPSHMQHLPWLKLLHYFSDFCCLVVRLFS